MRTTKQHLDLYIDELSQEAIRLKKTLEFLYDSSKGKSRIYVSSEIMSTLYHQTESIVATIDMVKNFNKLLYKNRGRGSSKKTLASKENGKLGGRPPKEIGDKKKRIQQLEEQAFIEQRSLTEEERKEYDELFMDITAWEFNKKNKIREELKNLNK